MEEAIEILKIKCESTQKEDHSKEDEDDASIGSEADNGIDIGRPPLQQKVNLPDHPTSPKKLAGKEKEKEKAAFDTKLKVLNDNAVVPAIIRRSSRRR